MRTRRLLATILAVALLSACQSPGSDRSGSSSTEAPPGPPSQNEGSAHRRSGVDSIEVGDGPVGLALGEDGAVWAVSAGADRVSRIPAGAMKPDLVVRVRGTPLRAAAAYGALWVTSFRAGELVRVDPAAGRVTDRIPTGAGPEGVTAAFGSVWVVAQDAGQLLRIDPHDLTVTDRIGIGVGARLVTAGQGSLYVSHYADGQVLRINPDSGHVQRSQRLCQGPQGMALEHNRLWLACTVDDSVLVLDPATLRVVDRLRAPDAPDAVTREPDGTVLSVSQAGPTVIGIDPRTYETVAHFALGAAAQLYDQANIEAVVAHNHVLVTSFSESVVLRASLP
jgi:DNA-binding beta-propeller fold protein YncE